ncbi:MAG: hypothetical protein GYA65_03705, partial [Actinobacteria bacterium]|nr:hypothetical protein [Actinomycetota bacterium]
MIAVVVVRAGQLPAGGAEAVAECAGRALLAGSGLAEAAAQLTGIATELTLVELGDFQPAAWAHGLAPLLAHEPAVLLPASPDGRDLAPRLAGLLHRPLYAAATAVGQADIIGEVRRLTPRERSHLQHQLKLRAAVHDCPCFAFQEFHERGMWLFTNEKLVLNRERLK